MSSQRDLSPYGVHGKSKVRRGGAAGLRPPGPYANQPQADNGPELLSQRDFFLLCGLAMFIMGAFNFLLPRQIELAKSVANMQRLWILHGVSIFGNLLGFWAVTRLFLRRFRDVLGGEELPGYARGLFRFTVLSPLLGVQMLILALFVPSSEGDRRGASSVLIAFVLSFVVVHGGYILWKVQAGRLSYVPAEARFAPVPNVMDEDGKALYEEIDQTAISAEYRPWMQLFDVHVMPYLNPSLRVGLGVGRDFLRVDALDELLDKKPGAHCRPPAPYIGVIVPNCFFEAYERLNTLQPFLTNAPALYYENKRRTAKGPFVQKIPSLADSSAPAVVTSLSESILMPIAQGLMAVDNMLRLVDPNHIRMSVREATKPVLLLPFFGNAELPFLELARDIQQMLIARSVSRSIQPQLPLLRAQLQPAQLALSKEEFGLIEQKLAELEARVEKLQKKPFATPQN